MGDRAIAGRGEFDQMSGRGGSGPRRMPTEMSAGKGGPRRGAGCQRQQKWHPHCQ